MNPEQSPPRNQGGTSLSFAGGNNSMAKERMGILDQLVHIARDMQTDIGKFFEFAAAETGHSDDRRSA